MLRFSPETKQITLLFALLRFVSNIELLASFFTRNEANSTANPNPNRIIINANYSYILICIHQTNNAMQIKYDLNNYKLIKITLIKI